jgi:hypothetical protein
MTNFFEFYLYFKEVEILFFCIRNLNKTDTPINKESKCEFYFFTK